MTIRSAEDLAGLRRVGQVVALALKAMAQGARPGMTTAELDAIGAGVLARHGARSAPRLAYDFPGVNCVCVNDEVVHGVPGERLLHAGDLVKIDVTAELDGYVVDAAVTVALPPASAVGHRLREAATAAFGRGLTAAYAGRPIRAIGRAVEGEVRRRGFAVIPELAGHGVGRAVHEPPAVPQYDEPRAGARLNEGLVITVEPIITAGVGRVVQDADGWTLRTADGSLSAHHEHTIVVTRRGPLILTAA